MKNIAERKKPYRYRPGSKALREIRKYQTSTELLIRKLPFQRLVRELARNHPRIGSTVRFSPMALATLQEAVEDHIVRHFQLANEIAINGNRVTVQVKDIQLVKRMIN